MYGDCEDKDRGGPKYTTSYGESKNDEELANLIVEMTQGKTFVSRDHEFWVFVVFNEKAKKLQLHVFDLFTEDVLYFRELK
tara:strand:- start:161 stop:403 length:243 start_codon:yes stop_codon:yes gene_type:complete